MPNRVYFHSYVFQEYAHVANEMPVFEFLEYSISCENLTLKFQVTQAPFVCTLFQVIQN